MDRGARITKAVSELLDDEDGKCCWCVKIHSFQREIMFRMLPFVYDIGNSVTAQCLLCYILLPDSRSKPDYKRIVFFCDVIISVQDRNVHINCACECSHYQHNKHGVCVCTHVCACVCSTLLVAVYIGNRQLHEDIASS